MYKIILILFFIVLIPSDAICQDGFDPDSLVDLTYEHAADFDRDGREERVIMHITGESMYVPFTWTLDIISLSDTLLHHYSDDSRIDSSFDEYCWPERKDYLSCKYWYYFQYMCRPPYNYGPSFAMLERHVKPYLDKSYDLSEVQIEKIIAALQERCDDPNTPYLELSICPAFSDLARVYVPEIKEFVIIYRP